MTGQDTAAVLPEVALPQAPAVRDGWEAADSQEQRFLIRNIDWTAYRKISEALGERHYRMSFDGANLELMTISKRHGSFSRFLAFVVGLLAEEVGSPFEPCGDMTLDREDLEQGVEADESFYLAHAPQMAGKDRLDLRTDPPPDLGVEIDLSTDARRRLGIYAKIAVPEIWRYDGKVVAILLRQNDGQYAQVEKSRQFPFLSAADLTGLLLQRQKADQFTVLRTFREWVRQQLKQR